MARLLRHLGDLEQQLGRHEEALRLYRRRAPSSRRRTAPTTRARSSLLGRRGQRRSTTWAGYDEALAIFERGLAAEERVVGPETHTAGTYLSFIGLARWQKKDYEGARKALERAVAVMEKVFGPDHVRRGPRALQPGHGPDRHEARTEAAACFERAARHPGARPGRRPPRPGARARPHRPGPHRARPAEAGHRAARALARASARRAAASRARSPSPASSWPRRSTARAASAAGSSCSCARPCADSSRAAAGSRRKATWRWPRSCAGGWPRRA